MNLRALVTRRAGDRCEYCGLPREESFYSFHIEHITPRQHGGDDSPENLALSCRRCNLFKGPNLAGIDPETGVIVPLFHPRQQEWDNHFKRDADRVAGLTPTGRVTVRLLRMNDEPRAELRGED